MSEFHNMEDLDDQGSVASDFSILPEASEVEAMTEAAQPFLSSAAQASADKETFDQVEFLNVCSSYPRKQDLLLHYCFTANHKPCVTDRLALFRVGFTSPTQYVMYEWAPREPPSAAPPTSLQAMVYAVKFNKSRLPRDTSEFYQVCYMSEGQTIKGVSKPFQLVVREDAGPSSIASSEGLDSVDQADGSVLVTSDISTLHSNIAMLQECVQRVRAEKVQVEEQMVSVQEKLRGKTEQADHLQKQLQELTAESKRDALEFASSSAAAEASFLQLQEENNNLNKLLTASREEVHRLQELQQGIKEELNKFSAQLASQSDELLTKDQLLEVANNQVAALTEKQKLLLDELQSCKKQRDEALQEVHDWRKVSSEEKNALADYEEKYTSLHEELQQQQDARLKVQQQLEQCQEQLVTCQRDLEQVREKASETERALAACQQLLQVSDERQRVLDQDNSTLQDSRHELEKELNEIRSQLRGAERVALEMSEQHQQLSQQQRQLTEENSQLERTSRKLKNKCTKLSSLIISQNVTEKIDALLGLHDVDSGQSDSDGEAEADAGAAASMGTKTVSCSSSQAVLELQKTVESRMDWVVEELLQIKSTMTARLMEESTTSVSVEEDELSLRKRVKEQQEGGVKQQEGDVEQQEGDVEQQEGDVEQQEGDVEQQEGDVEQQEGDVEQQEGDVEQQEGDVEQQEGDVEQPEGDVKQQVGDVEQQVKDVKQQEHDGEQQEKDMGAADETVSNASSWVSVRTGARGSDNSQAPVSSVESIVNQTASSVRSIINETRSVIESERIISAVVNDEGIVTGAAKESADSASVVEAEHQNKETDTFSDAPTRPASTVIDIEAESLEQLPPQLKQESFEQVREQMQQLTQQEPEQEEQQSVQEQQPVREQQQATQEQQQATQEQQQPPYQQGYPEAVNLTYYTPVFTAGQTAPVFLNGYGQRTPHSMGSATEQHQHHAGPGTSYYQPDCSGSIPLPYPPLYPVPPPPGCIPLPPPPFHGVGSSTLPPPLLPEVTEGARHAAILSLSTIGAAAAQAYSTITHSLTPPAYTATSAPAATTTTTTDANNQQQTYTQTNGQSTECPSRPAVDVTTDGNRQAESFSDTDRSSTSSQQQNTSASSDVSQQQQQFSARGPAPLHCHMPGYGVWGPHPAAMNHHLQHQHFHHQQMDFHRRQHRARMTQFHERMQHLHQQRFPSSRLHRRQHQNHAAHHLFEDDVEGDDAEQMQVPEAAARDVEAAAREVEAAAREVEAAAREAEATARAVEAAAVVPGETRPATSRDQQDDGYLHCPMCQLKFGKNSSGLLQEHIDSHLEFICPVCNVAYQRSMNDAFLEHVESHFEDDGLAPSAPQHGEDQPSGVWARAMHFMETD